MREVPTHAGMLRAARWAGRVVVLVGIALFVLGAWETGSSWYRGLWRAGLIIAIAGCWELATLVGLWRSPRGRLGIDVALGVICLVLGLFNLFGATDEGGSTAHFPAIVGGLLVLGGVALVMAATVAKRFAERWRNTPGSQ